MSNADRYVHGAWNVICDRCGFKYKNHNLRQEWNGLRTCHGSGTNGCWEKRQPQDFVKSKADRQHTAWSRPEAPDVFLTTNEITRDDL